MSERVHGMTLRAPPIRGPDAKHRRQPWRVQPGDANAVSSCRLVRLFPSPFWPVKKGISRQNRPKERLYKGEHFKRYSHRIPSIQWCEVVWFRQGVPRTSESVPPIAKTGLLKRTARTLGRAQRPKLILSERDRVARVGSISVERGRGSGPFQTAKALFVHFGAIKMDIEVGNNLNGWRERTVE